MFWRTLTTYYPFWSILGMTGAAYLHRRSVLRSSLKLIGESAATEELLLDWHTRYGYSPHSLVSIFPQAQVWRDTKGRGVVPYLAIDNSWLVSGEPFIQPDIIPEVMSNFLAQARAERRFVGLVPTTSRLAANAETLGLDAVPIGVAPYFDLTSWAPKGDSGKKVRAGVNQARRAGINVTTTDGNDLTLLEVQNLCNAWLQTRKNIPFGWLFSLDPLRFKAHKRFFVARDDSGNMMGLLAASPIPLRSGWYLEDVLRHPQAPNGTAELLIVEGMAQLAKTGAQMATLGTVPAAKLPFGAELSRGNHRILTQVLTQMSQRMEWFYNFQGLYRFKAKFNPSWWEAEYALFSPGMLSSSKLGYAVLRAMSPQGLLPLLWHGISTKN